MKLINLSDVVSITISTPSEAEFFTSLDALNNKKREVFYPQANQGDLTVLQGIITKENEIRGVIYPIVNFKLKDGSNAILKLDLKAIRSAEIDNFIKGPGKDAAPAEVKAPIKKEPVKVDPIRVNTWKKLSKDAVSQFLFESNLFKSTFVRVY